MSSLPAAQVVFDAVREDLGKPPFQILEGVAGVRAARRAAHALAKDPRGGLVATVMQDHTAAALIGARLKGMEGREFAEVRSVPVEEGYLLLALVSARPSTAPRSSKAVARDARTALDHSSAELRPVEGATLHELDEHAFASLDLRRVPVEGLSARYGVLGRRMQAVGVAVEYKRELVPTVAGLLVFGHRPELFIPGARFLVSADGREAEFTGCAQAMVEGALRWKPLTKTIGADLVKPLLVNAIAHRDWSAKAEEQAIQVTRRGAYLEVRHPGAIARGAPCNPALFSLLVRVCLARGEGSGMRHIGEVMRGLDGRPMSLAARGGTVVAVLEMPWQAAPVDQPLGTAAPAPPPAAPVAVVRPQAEPPPVGLAPPQPVVPKPDPVSAPAPAPAPPEPPQPEPQPRRPREYRSREDRQAELLEYLRSHGQQTTRELLKALGWSRATTRSVLAALVDDGLVGTTAATPNAPHQAYEACES